MECMANSPCKRMQAWRLCDSLSGEIGGQNGQARGQLISLFQAGLSSLAGQVCCRYKKYATVRLTVSFAVQMPDRFAA